MLIGVTPQSRSTEGYFRSKIWGLLKPYLRALESQGAGIVILPPQEGHRLPAILHKLDGVLLPGGVDLDPAHFGEEPLPQMGEVSPERDTMELFVARYTAQHGIPTLGVCRGIQVMNVALGGSLYQDLATQGFSTIQHSQKTEPPVLGHSVEQTGNSPLNRLFEPRFRVNSYHHQALKNLAPGLRPIASARDGIVEAVVLEGHPFYEASRLRDSGKAVTYWGYSGTPSYCRSSGVFLARCSRLPDNQSASECLRSGRRSSPEVLVPTSIHLVGSVAGCWV